MCAAPAWGGAHINSIEINQAIGNQYNGHQNFVAGKNTVVRAFLSEPVVVGTANMDTKLPGPADTIAVVKREGTTVVVLAPKPTGLPSNVIDFPCPDLEQCGNWAEGTYDFEVTVQGETLASRGIKFQARKSLKILAVPMKTNYGGQVLDYPNDKWKTLWTFARDVYPIGHRSINWVQREMLDVSDGSKYDLNTDRGQYGVWKTLRDLNPMHCPPVGRVPGNDCYDLIVGFMPKNVPDASGYTMGKPANVVTGTDPDAGATVAHEAAHLFNIGDTYKGGDFNCSVNPAPDGWRGKDWVNPDKVVSCTQGAVGYEDIGTRIPASSHPYDVNGRGPLGDMADYMGRSGDDKQFWGTPETYDHLFSQFAPSVASNVKRNDLLTLQRLIAYSGTISAIDNAVTLEPWKSFSDSLDIPDTTGTYTIKALDLSGNTLATQALEVEFSVRSNPPRQLNTAPFQGTMRFPEGTAKFQIVAGNTVLNEKTVTEPPTISDVTPTDPGTEVTGKYTIRWNGNTVDGNHLTYTVEYNPSTSDPGSEWNVLATQLDENEWTENFDDLTGGTGARIRVTATDGINAVSALSAIFTVPPKPPEVYIEQPDAGTDYEYGDEILLKAEAYDLQDEWLPDDKIVWNSNINGSIGKGSVLAVKNLIPGEHIITVTATDNSGLSATDQIILTISSCSFTVSPATRAFSSSGGSGLLSVTAVPQVWGNKSVCSLTNDDIQLKTYDDGKWLNAKLTTFRSGRGSVRITVSPNDSKYVRTGSVFVKGSRMDVTQKEAPCSMAITPHRGNFRKGGGTGEIQISMPRGCDTAWTATTDQQWLQITSEASGTGNGVVTYSVLQSENRRARTGRIRINNKEFTVVQSNMP